MPRLDRLPPRDADGQLRLVVETPRGARLKMAFDPVAQAISVDRALPEGLVYPYDWGFVPGTLADDGDPLDGMLIGTQTLSPGVLVPVRPLGVLRLKQRDHGAKQSVRNDRVIFAPIYDDPYPQLNEAPVGLRTELEHFFEAIARDEKRELFLEGWLDADVALKLVDKSARKARKARRAG